MILMEEATREQLKGELKRRKHKIPLWQRQPLWWKIFDWVTDYFAAWYLIILSPIWFPFWLAHKIHKHEVKQRAEMLKEESTQQGEE